MSDSLSAGLAEAALRGGAMLILVLLAALLLRDMGRSAVARLGAFLAIGVAAYTVCSASFIVTGPAWWHAPLAALASANAFVFLVLARGLFDDAFRICPHALAIWALFALGGAIDFHLRGGFAATPGPLTLILGAGRLACAVGAVVPVLATWRDDLVESRRRLRAFIVLAIAGHLVLDIAATSILPPSSPLAGLVGGAGLLIIALLIAWPLVGVARADLFPVAPIIPPAPGAKPFPTPPAPAAIDPEDARAVEALLRVMREERAYRAEGLTIAQLSARLRLPEYRLRRLINGHLGHRNFNAFVNGFRIAEAKAALGDPAQAEVPILTIAMDAGFQSLGPFNRAFKAETGLTPSDFRRAAAGIQAIDLTE